ASSFCVSFHAQSPALLAASATHRRSCSSWQLCRARRNSSRAVDASLLAYKLSPILSRVPATARGLSRLCQSVSAWRFKSTERSAASAADEEATLLAKVASS